MKTSLALHVGCSRASNTLYMETWLALHVGCIVQLHTLHDHWYSSSTNKIDGHSTIRARQASWTTLVEACKSFFPSKAREKDLYVCFMVDTFIL